MEHQWEVKPGEPHPYWEERRCTVCHLDDMRLRDRNSNPNGPRYNWGVKMPCIEPVPNVVDYSALVQELRERKVPRHVLCVGVPGKWFVGFQIPRTYPYPMLEAKTIEEGFAELLRWIRARQYDVYKHSDMSYQEKEPDSGAYEMD